MTLVRKLPVVPSAKAGSMAEAPSGIAWREQHPLIGDKCNQCLECTLFCPEGSLIQKDGMVTTSLNLCNGCGICAVECRQEAVTMAPEYNGIPGVFPVKEGKL